MATRQRTGAMLCYEYTEKRLKTWPKPYIVQPKIEGDRCRSVYHPDNGWTLFSSTESERWSVPHINDFLNRTDYHNSYTELDGEAYKHGLKHEEIRSIFSRTVDRHPDYEQLQFYIFDIPSSEKQIIRTSELEAIKTEGPIVRVPSYFCNNLDEVTEQYEQFILDGYEGIVLRNPNGLYKRSRSTDIMKLKPRKEITALVTELLQEHDINGIPRDSLGAVECHHPEVASAFRVGTGFTDEQRKHYWNHPEEILGKLIEVQYQAMTETSLKMASFKRVVGNYDFD